MNQQDAREYRRIKRYIAEIRSLKRELAEVKLQLEKLRNSNSHS